MLEGRAGDDRLIGGDGTDSMTGGLGDDLFSVLSISDQVIEEAAAGYDTVLAGVNYVLGENIEQLNLAGTANFGQGNGLDNRIVGNNNGVLLSGFEGADQLFGGSGSDRLTGGRGLDVSTGRGGADLFIFDDSDSGATTGNADVIADFSRAQGDRIHLRAVDANESTPDEDQNFTFIGTGAFSGEARELRYETTGGNTYVYGDTDGDAVADLVIRLEGTHTLQQADFVL